MLESTYILIGFIPFVFLLVSLFNKKRPARLALQFIATILFGAMGAASMQVEDFTCQDIITLTNSTNVSYSESNNTIITYNNDILCEKNSTFDDASVWIFSGMTMISAVITFLTAINTLSMKEED